MRLRDDLIISRALRLHDATKGQVAERGERPMAAPPAPIRAITIRARRDVIGAATPNWHAAWISTFSPGDRPAIGLQTYRRHERNLAAIDL